ncbi:adipokinetic prohormone type 3-like [Schistocerca serialis cubense]|uniref:adipokinetic prohormone type 3-like n=1 Tax=Schistocerca serialis cubense TaxID=2023355 RepID=UPI00214E8160|nr:adipokinetic prohormone type 3-like [Schistocerca serialis cubense]
MRTRTVCLLAVFVLVAVAACRAQVNFTPWWGKRALVSPSSHDCVSSSPEALLSMLRAAQAEVQKLADCKMLTSQANS